MQEKKQRHYHPTIDLLRVIAILAVIMIHTTTRTLEVSHYDLQKIPWTLFLNQISRFAVPLFFMISGFVLELNYPFHFSYSSYLKKRCSRIFIPYVFWSAIYYFFVYKQHTIDYFQSLLGGNASYQLYFIPTLLIFYIIFPLLHRYYHVIARTWLIIALGIVQMLLLAYDYYLHPLPFFYPLSIALLNFYIFFLGIFASHHKDKLLTMIHKWKIIIFSLTVVLGFYIFFEGENFYSNTQNSLSFYSQWRPSILIYTTLVAGSLYYLFNKNLKSFFIIKILSRLSFFVFFIHVIILETVWWIVSFSVFQKYHDSIRQIWYDPLFFGTVACVSFFIAYIAHKIPKLAKVTG